MISIIQFNFRINIFNIYTDNHNNYYYIFLKEMRWADFELIEIYYQHKRDNRFERQTNCEVGTQSHGSSMKNRRVPGCRDRLVRNNIRYFSKNTREDPQFSIFVNLFLIRRNTMICTLYIPAFFVFLATQFLFSNLSKSIPIPSACISRVNIFVKA